MTVEAWVFKYGSTPTVFTSDVMSFAGNAGRKNYMDNYAGGTFHLTIKNQSNQAANFTRGTVVKIEFSDGTVFQYGTVIGIDYNDYPGNTGLSTATVSCQDELTRAGKYNLQNFLYAADKTTAQATQTNNSSSGLPTPEVIAVGTGESWAGYDRTYYGSILNRLNLLNSTERGQLIAKSTGITFLARSQVFGANTVTLNQSVSGALLLRYSNFRRFISGDNFMNQVTCNYVTDGNAGVGIASNPSSIAAYGSSGYQFNSADLYNGQATGLAEWLSNIQGDPNLLRFEIDFDDATASPAAIETFFKNVITSNSVTTNLTWRVPGSGSNTTTKVILEGFDFSGTPSKTSYTIYLSQFSLYEYFILDSSTQGILDSSRLAWVY